MFMIPIIEGWANTYENTEVRTERERELHFGQFDHVRYYGADVRNRARKAGFGLTEFTAEAEDCVRHALLRGEKVFVATKL